MGWGTFCEESNPTLLRDWETFRGWGKFCDEPHTATSLGELLGARHIV